MLRFPETAAWNSATNSPGDVNAVATLVPPPIAPAVSASTHMQNTPDIYKTNLHQLCRQRGNARKDSKPLLKTRLSARHHPGGKRYRDTTGKTLEKELSPFETKNYAVFV